MSQNFYFKLLPTKSLLGLSSAGCRVKWHVCAHRSGFTHELLDSSLAKAATANRFFAGNQHHFMLIHLGSQPWLWNSWWNEGVFPVFYSIRLLHKSCPHLRKFKVWKSWEFVKKFVSGSLRNRETPGASLICLFEQCSPSEHMHNIVKNFPGDIWLRIVVVRPIVCKILNFFPVWVRS